MKVLSGAAAMVGNTPLVRINRLVHPGAAAVYCKIESRNPCAGIKDRVAVAMIDAAEKDGFLKPGGTIVEASGGNTGIALAFIAAVRGYKMIVTMPESAPAGRRALMCHLGAEIVLTDATRGMSGAIEKAAAISSGNNNAFMPDQFSNSANPAVHERTTGAEIIRDLGGEVDIFVSGIGTGGTITGVGRALKKHNRAVQVIGVEPDESAVLSGEPPGFHYIHGIGAGFRPSLLDMAVVDRIVRVKGIDAVAKARQLAAMEGISGGISSGANLKVALELAILSENSGKNIVTVVYDSGERYLATQLFQK